MEYKIYVQRLTYKGGYPSRTKYQGTRYRLYDSAHNLVLEVNGFASNIDTLPKFIALAKRKGYLQEGSTHTITRERIHENY